MPHRLLQAVWQAQQALMEVGQIAEQLLREQELRNSWPNHSTNQQPYLNAYETVYSPVHYGTPGNQQQMTGQAGYMHGHMMNPVHPSQMNPYFPQQMNWNQEFQPQHFQAMDQSGMLGTKVEPVFEGMKMEEPFEESPKPMQSKPKGRKNNQQDSK